MPFRGAERKILLKAKQLLIAGLFIVSICASALVGHYISKQSTLKERAHTTQTFISFSIGKLEDLKKGYDADTTEALISDVYAAMQFTDDAALASALHELWNALIFDGENIVGREDILIKALEDTNAQDMKEIAFGMRTIG